MMLRSNKKEYSAPIGYILETSTMLHTLEDIELSVVTEEGTVEDVIVADSDTIEEFIKDMYGDRIYRYSTFTQEGEELELLTTRLSTTWHDFFSNPDNKVSWGVLYRALIIEKYNPLENYNGTVETTLTKEGTETNSFNNGTGSTNSSKEFQIPDYSEYGTPVELELSKSEVTNGARTEENELSFQDRTDTTVEKRHGNLGITTPADMIKGEKSIRLNETIMETLVSQFIRRYTI